jgi:hypothetical protein
MIVVYVFGLLAIGLAFACLRADGKGARIFLGVFCALNAFCAVHAIFHNDPYAFKLRPNDGYIEPARATQAPATRSLRSY